MNSSKYESNFIKAYEQEEFSSQSYQSAINSFENAMKDIGVIPTNDMIYKCKVFSIPDFLGITFDKDPQLFFDATMATGELLCNILLLPDVIEYTYDFSKLPEITQHFQSIVKAALWIRCIELGKKVENPKIDFPKIFEFMANVMLPQHLLIHSRAFRAFVEVIGSFFINSLNNNSFITQSNDKKQSELYKLVKSFISNEQKNSNSSEPPNDYQVYLNFVRTVIILYNDHQLPDLLCNSPIIKEATDFGIPAFFCSFIDFLSSMIMTPELAEYAFNYVENTSSEIFCFNNFLSAIFNHPHDLQVETDRQKLDEKDSLGLESVLRFLTSLFRQDLQYLEKISKSINFSQDHPDETFENYLVKSLIKFVLLPVPASLKAECFNCLASLRFNLWNHLHASNIFVYDKTEKPNEGIVSDINNIEAPYNTFSLPQAISNLFASLLEIEEFSPPNFKVYHDILYEVILRNLNTWKYHHPDMKWEILQNLCKVWINLLKRKNFLDLCDPLYRSAITEPEFIGELARLSNDDLCPVECLINIYRLFLLLSWKETEFLRKALSSNTPLTAGIVNKISRDIGEELGATPKGVIKMLRCFLSHSMRLQIVSMELLEFIASASPIIVQVLLAKPGVNSLNICNSLIKLDESENINDFQLDVYDCVFNNKSIFEKLERDEKDNPIQLNARCFLLHSLITLGSSSFFVRHVCGFDQHDPPKSILETNIDSGILLSIINKLCEENTHLMYPTFVAKSFQILLLECKHNLTINSTLNLLRSSLRSFFITQLRFLSNPNSSRIAIGCFLQIMALENANSAATGSGLTGIIRDSFEFLMLPLKNSQQSINPWMRNVLFLDFIDRIENDEESKYILNGINDLTVAYLSNLSIIALMNEYKQYWPSSWMQIIFCLLEKVPKLINDELSQKVVGTCSLIANAVLVDKKFGPVNPDDLKKLFTMTLEITSLLFDYKHHSSRIATYSLLNTAANVIVCDEEIMEILQNKEQMVLDATLNDCKSDIPILRSISFAVIESLIPFASHWAFIPFLEQAIATTEDDWRLFETNTDAACFCLSAKCKMYSKFIISLKSDTSFSISHVSPDCKIIINESLIIKLSNESFWKSLDEMLTNCSENESKLQTAADILSLFSVISVAFNDSEDLRIQLNWFLKKFLKPLIAFIELGKAPTINSLKLYASFIKLLSTLPKVEDLEELDILYHLPFIFRKFSNEEEIEKDNQEIFKMTQKAISQKIISQLLMSGIVVLAKISETRDVFTAPLFGEDSEIKLNPMSKNDELLPLSVITSYLGKLLKEIKEIETGIRNVTNENDTEVEVACNATTKRSIASSCLLLIWYHINRWKHGSVYFDMGRIKEQAGAFKNEPYINFTGNSSLDSLILEQLVE